jgi:prepilin-type N-terminal cleavage/methylation domain-containing protein
VRRRDRMGFTLIEVVVALALGGLILLGARRMLEQLADEAYRITRDAAAADADANGERVLRALAGRLEVGTGDAGPFAGEPAATRFTTWCEVPDGWLERCRVTLVIAPAAGAPASAPVLVAQIPGRAPLPLVRGVQADGLRYLVTAAHGGEWFRSWGEGITAPVALGVIRVRGEVRDTLIVRIGERG